uniref:Uncharacterized protein n=1 Tax=Ciona intestinalis TaxID=7719 RepID=H2XUC3_CIOIN
MHWSKRSWLTPILSLFMNCRYSAAGYDEIRWHLYPIFPDRVLNDY